MNFFKQQDINKRYSFWLIVLFVVGFLGIAYVYKIVLSFLITFINIFILQREFIQLSDQWLYIIIASALGFSSISKIEKLVKDGGSGIARSLGGKRIFHGTIDPYEQRLISIVEQISIASGSIMPKMYVLEEGNINAFVAGNNQYDAILGITRGAIEFLDNDELKGVVAHEFAHIYNGDMKIDTLTAGTLYGIVAIATFGYFISTGISRKRDFGRHTNSSDASEIALAYPALHVIGITIFLFGWLGFAIAEIIKKQLNQKREYLADASAVQFTRYPKGLANALKKIGGSQDGSRIRSAQAIVFSHLFFCNAIGKLESFLSSHPPLDERIYKIEPKWNGDYILPKKQKISLDNNFEKQKAEKNISQLLATSAILSLEQNDIFSESNIQEVSFMLSEFSAELMDMIRNPLSSQLVIFALLLDKQENKRKEQVEFLNKSMPNLALMQQKAIDLISRPQKKYHLPITKLCLSSLKELSLEQYKVFKDNFIKLINLDNNVSIHEWSMSYLILFPLDITYKIKQYPKIKYKNISFVKFEVQTILSTFIYSYTNDDKKAKEIFDSLIYKLDLSSYKYINSTILTQRLFSSAIDTIMQTSIDVRRDILNIVISFLNHDSEISEEDKKIIYALGTAMDIKIEKTN